jgi:hypothetical protein
VSHLQSHLPTHHSRPTHLRSTGRSPGPDDPPADEEPATQECGANAECACDCIRCRVNLRSFAPPSSRSNGRISTRYTACSVGSLQRCKLVRSLARNASASDDPEPPAAPPPASPPAPPPAAPPGAKACISAHTHWIINLSTLPPSASDPAGLVPE